MGCRDGLWRQTMLTVGHRSPMKQQQMMTLVFSLIVLGVNILIEATILTVALWIMIKVQKLNYSFLGLLGTAGLASALDVILGLMFGHFLGGWLGSYLSRPIVVVVLFICISKVTEADLVDVTFTIVVGYAVYFCLNLFLLAALLPTPGRAEEGSEFAAYETERQPELQSAQTNRAATPIAPAIRPTNPAAAKVAAPAKAPEKTVTAAVSSEPAQAGPVAKIPKGFSLKGIISGSNPSAMISTGVRTYTIFQGDTLTMETADGKVDVSCEKLEADKAHLNIGGDSVVLLLSAGRR
jgi:hypothetical protein